MNSLVKSCLLAAILLLVSWNAPAQQDRGPAKTKSFSVSKGGRLVVTVNGGEIRITPWDKNEVHVAVFPGEDDDLDDLRMTDNGAAVRIENFGGGSSDDTRYEINVPSTFDLDLRTSNGLLAVGGPLTGEVKGSTSAGDIRVGDVTGSVDMQTSGGDIRARNVTGDLTLRTAGGEIVAGEVSGEVDVRTSGGDIRLGNLKKKVWAKTSGGNITVGDVGAEAEISTSGGNVAVGKVAGSASITTAGGDIDLEGATGAVVAKTAGGNIRLLNVTGTVDAKTAGGDVDAELSPSGKGGSRLVTASGNIRLSLPASAKATVRARIRVQGRWHSQRDDYAIKSDFEAKSYQLNDEDHEIVGTYLVNGGGETVTLETVNADISIRKTGAK